MPHLAHEAGGVLHGDTAEVGGVSLAQRRGDPHRQGTAVHPASKCPSTYRPWGNLAAWEGLTCWVPTSPWSLY